MQQLGLHRLGKKIAQFRPFMLSMIIVFTSSYAHALTIEHTAKDISSKNEPVTEIPIYETPVIETVPMIAIPTNNQSKSAPITIDANNQQIDMKKNTITFTGNVVMKQEGLIVFADNVIITNIQNREAQIITAYGKPVRFEKDMNNDPKQKVTGHSDILIYTVRNDTLKLKDNAELFQQDNHIKGDLITYHLGDQKIFAEANSGKRIQTTIIPNQLQEIKK